ncbi:MAG: hypothetical protein ACOVP7_07335 [Lacibacter sp.]
MKQIVVEFNVAGGTERQYNQIWDDLKNAGYEHPNGIISHVGFAKPGAWCVVDVWESQEAFDEFSKALVPLLEKNVFKEGRPVVYPAHYVYIGETEHAYA